MTVNLLARVVALLCEHADFDAIRSTSAEATEAVNAISAESVHLTVFEWLLSLYSDPSLAPLRSNVMSSMGA
jgi:cohesin loading factor subunit SCC2